MMYVLAPLEGQRTNTYEGGRQRIADEEHITNGIKNSIVHHFSIENVVA